MTTRTEKAERVALEMEIEQVWVELSNRRAPVEIRLTRAGRLLGLHSRTEHGEVVGVFDSRVSLAHFRDTVFDAWEDLTRG
jgi:hypothetical protein